MSSDGWSGRPASVARQEASRRESCVDKRRSGQKHSVPRRAGLTALLSFQSVVTSKALQDDRATMRPLQRQVKPITSRRPGTNCPLRRSGAHPANIQEKAPFPDISAAKCATDGKELAIDMHARGPSVTSPFLVITAPFMVTNDSRPSRSLQGVHRRPNSIYI